MELRDVAERGDAPRGSIYHHFPGGKRQLAAAAAALEGERVRDDDRALAGRARPARDAADVRRAVPPPRRRTTRSGSAARLPPPRSRAPRTPRSPPPRPPPSAAGRRDRAALRGEGVAPKQARPFAALVVSTIEGALVRTRAAGDHAPLDDAVAGLAQALDALLAA